METPSEYFKRLLEDYKKNNPKDHINEPPQSEFVKSGAFNEVLNKIIEDGKA